MTQKELIIECAANMFVAQGVKAVRMDDIAQTLSVSKRTLYELFGDKEELLYQSIQHFAAKGRERRIHHAQSVDNVLEVMLVCLRDMIAKSPEIRRMRRNMQRFYPAVAERLDKDAHLNSINDLREWITNCVEQGYFTATANNEFVIKVLSDSVQGMMGPELYDNRDSLELISMMSYALVIFIRGLCTVKGMEVIDQCFEKYFGNISPIESL